MIHRYPYTDFNEYNLDWCIERVKQLTSDWLETQEEWTGTKAEWTALYNYVHDYFDNLDVSQEVGQIIDDYRRDGTLATICQPIVDHWVEDNVPDQIDGWLDSHVTQETGYVLDSSLTLANAAAPAKTVGDALTDVNNALDDVKTGVIYGTENAISGNLFPFRTDTIDGKYYSVSNGELVEETNANYYGFILKVKPNTEYHCTFFRFLILLDSAKTPIGEMQSSSTIINTDSAEYIAVSFDKTLYSVENYCINVGSVLDASDFKINLEWLYFDNNIAKKLANGFYAEKANAEANSTLMLNDFSNNVKYNKTLVYEAHFTGSIGNITIYHGSGMYGSYVRVTPTNIIVNTNGTDVYDEPHTLTIADYLYVLIDTNENDEAKISVMSNGKRVEITPTWRGWQGSIFAITISPLTFHRITWISKEINNSIWIFGDSYLSKTSNDRWGYYLKEWGFDNYMSIGYPGANSNNVINTLLNIIEITQPKYLIWTMGMNEPDSSAEINASWETNAETVLDICNKYNITPIFAKIPNANGAGNLYNHSFKNAWIDEKDIRFIDLPFSVGADANGDWYSGLIASDGIHPSWKGAEAMAYQILSDVPELTHKN